MIRRLLFFALLGPPIGALTLLFAVLPLIALATGDATPLEMVTPDIIPGGLLIAYIVGLAPAAVTGAIDGALVGRGVARPRRAAIVALAGGLLGLLPIVPLLWGAYVHGPLPLATTLCGAVAGAACSLLAGLGETPGRAA